MKVIQLVLNISLAALLVGCKTTIPVTEPKIQSITERLELGGSNDVFVIAHRACWQESPENSVSAINECINAGIDMVEIDVRQTADGHLILMHDETVDRTTNGSGRVDQLTLESIKKMRLKAQDGGPESLVSDGAVPTLREVLNAAKAKIYINLDIKADLYEKAFELLEETETTDQILMKMVALPNDPKLRTAKFLGRTAFMPIIRQCREAEKGICSPDLNEVLPGYFDLDPVAYEIVFQSEDYLRDGLSLMKSDRARIWVNTLQAHHAAGHLDAEAAQNPDAHWGYLMDLGANMIQTDKPIVLIEYLRSKGLHK